ncbi:hypothetical protein D3C86_1531450 [compost metagenome]
MVRDQPLRTLRCIIILPLPVIEDNHLKIVIILSGNLLHLGPEILGQSRCVHDNKLRINRKSRCHLQSLKEQVKGLFAGLQHHLIILVIVISKHFLTDLIGGQILHVGPDIPAGIRKTQAGNQHFLGKRSLAALR